MAWQSNQDDQWWRGDSKDTTDPHIRLMHHDARWRQEFQQTRSSLLQCCEGRVTWIEHVGSTSVPGVIARPIIDIVAAVTLEQDLRESAQLIEGLNFRVADSPEWAGSTITLDKPRHGEPTHRVFLVTPNTSFASRLTRVRDHLRSDPELAIDFETAKLEFWRESEGEVQLYEAAKANYFNELEEKLNGMGDA